MSDLPPEAWAVALAGLPAMGPARLRSVLQRWPAREAWERVRGRAVCDAGALTEVWAIAASTVDVGAAWQQHVEAGIGVAVLGSSTYPDALACDVEPPVVLFSVGDPSVVSGPRVAIVGTRNATRYGMDIARQLGFELSRAGVAIVSGLAMGIDGAAHAGALAAAVARPIAVVGSGLDVVYPRQNKSLWREVERVGVVLSESPLGAAPERWRFPARNRIIAALADAVIVVESREIGGSMHTVNEAETRGRPVFAVPGPVRSNASSGTNRLLRDGAHVLCDVSDVLVTLGLSAALTRSIRDPRAEPVADDRTVLEAVGWSPASLDDLVARTQRPLAELALALSRLQDGGWVQARGGWYERVARRDG